VKEYLPERGGFFLEKRERRHPHLASPVKGEGRYEGSSTLKGTRYPKITLRYGRGKEKGRERVTGS